LQAGQKDLRGEPPVCQAQADPINRFFDLAQDRLNGGVLRYVGAIPHGAGMIPAAIERNYPKRLLEAGWWHMSLFQQPISD